MYTWLYVRYIVQKRIIYEKGIEFFAEFFLLNTHTLTWVRTKVVINMYFGANIYPEARFILDMCVTWNDLHTHISTTAASGVWMYLYI